MYVNIILILRKCVGNIQTLNSFIYLLYDFRVIVNSPTFFCFLLFPVAFFFFFFYSHRKPGMNNSIIISWSPFNCSNPFSFLVILYFPLMSFKIDVHILAAIKLQPQYLQFHFCCVLWTTKINQNVMLINKSHNQAKKENKQI